MLCHIPDLEEPSALTAAKLDWQCLLLLLLPQALHLMRHVVLQVWSQLVPLCPIHLGWVQVCAPWHTCHTQLDVRASGPSHVQQAPHCCSCGAHLTVCPVKDGAAAAAAAGGPLRACWQLL
jgi:hypothetical protein